MDALKSPPPKEGPAKRTGWKVKVPPKEGAQRTLKEAFDAGKLVQEAKKLKRKALQNMDMKELDADWEVSYHDEDGYRKWVKLGSILFCRIVQSN